MVLQQFWNSNAHNLVVFSLLTAAIVPPGTLTPLGLVRKDHPADARYFIKIRNNLRQWKYW
jgi:hypothetical protein